MREYSRYDIGLCKIAQKPCVCIHFIYDGLDRPESPSFINFLVYCFAKMRKNVSKKNHNHITTQKERKKKRKKSEVKSEKRRSNVIVS